MTDSTSRARHLESALAESFVEGEFADIRFYLFTRRLRTGKVGTPCALYANSTVLKAASPYFHGLFSVVLNGGFSESSSSGGRNSGFPGNQPNTTDAYDYNSDSDLDDEEEDNEGNNADSPVTSREAHDANGSSPVLNDKNLEMSATSAVTSSAARSLRTIVIKDAALTTWKWLVFYVYTGQIGFAPLRSQGTRHHLIALERYRSEHPQRPLLCSPKSMYRLADKLGMDALKTTAANDIRMKLSTENISDELFSRFTAWYPELLDMQIKFFCDNCLDGSVLPSLEQKVAGIAAGRMPHADAALTALFRAWISRSPVPQSVAAAVAEDEGWCTPATTKSIRSKGR